MLPGRYSPVADIATLTIFEVAQVVAPAEKRHSVSGNVSIHSTYDGQAASMSIDVVVA